MTIAIHAHELTKKYADFTAVDRISFEINEGECFGFLGPNGAGKTTSVKLIHCVSPITSGSISVFGEPADLKNRRIKMLTGVIPQEITLDVDLTVYENLMVFAMFFDIAGSEAKKRISELLSFVELTSKKNSRIKELSTGMKRRLLVARALLNNPRLIIADEPTTGLDPQARHLIWQRLRQLKQQGTTLILTTQYMEEAERLCDRIIIMYQGRILKQGTPAELVREEIGTNVAEIRVTKEDDEKRAMELSSCSCGRERVGDTIYFYCRDGRELRNRIITLNLSNVVYRPATLEDVFLKLTGRSLID